MKEKCCLLLIVIILCGSLIVFQEPQELEEREEEVDNMTIYGYKRIGYLDTWVYPNPYWCVAETPNGLYFYDTLQGKLYKTEDEETIEDLGSYEDVYGFWYDRTNELIYFTEAISADFDGKVYMLDLSDDSITQVGATFDSFTAEAIYDIFMISTDLFVVDYVDDTGTNKIKIFKWVDPNWVEQVSITYPLNDLGIFTVIGTDAYVIFTDTGGDSDIIKFDSTTPAISSVETISSMSIPAIGGKPNSKTITYDDNDIISFILVDGALDLYYYTYIISTDTLTKGAEYKIVLGANRTTDSSNAIPFNLEKGFHVDSQFIYQISKDKLFKIADLTNIVTSGMVIKSITDTYAFLYKAAQPEGSSVEIIKFQDMSNHYTLAEITHAERDYATCEIIYDIRSLELTSDMFVQIIGTLEGVADQVIFEGYVEKPELLEEKGRYIYIALLKSPAFRDLDYASPSGEYSGRSDEHITDDITDNDGYITKDTFSNGQALGTFLYAMDKNRRIVYNELGAGDQFTWALTPTGGMLYNNGAVDSGVDYSQATPIWDVHISYREVRVNWVQVKGAFVDGIQVESTVRQNLELQQQYGGKIKFEITIGTINTVALANAWGDALLALLSAQMTEVIFKVRDTTNGFIQPSKEITLAYTHIPVIASAQYKINQIIHNDRTKISEYVVSNIVRYEIADFKGKLAQDNQEILYQINSHIVGHAGLTNLTGWDINTAVALSFNDGTRTFTATPTGTITYYIQGIKYYLSVAETVIITDTEGLWYIYFDGTTLTASQTPWDILDNDKAMVSILYWDATNNKQLILTQQLHSHEMDSATHERFHDVSGMQISSGGTLSDMIVDGDASLDTHAQFQNDETIGHDEDLEFTLSARAKATNLPVFYRDGVDGSLIWRIDEDDPYPIANTGVGGEDRAAWNELTGGSWQLTEVTDSKFVLAHIIATTDADRPFICLVGQAEYASKTAARTGAETELTNIIIAGLTTEEFRVLATIIIQTKDSYANTPKSKIVSTAEGGDYIDWTATLSSRIGIGQTSQVSDDAYDATDWDAVTTIAPSKNAVRDEFENNRLTKTIIESYFAIGSANKRYIVCTMLGGSPFSALNAYGFVVANAGATDFALHYNIPLPPTLGSKKLYLNNLQIGIYDADAVGGDYLDRVRVHKWTAYNANTTLLDDGTNRDAAGEYDYDMGAVDVSDAKELYIRMNIVSTTVNEFDLAYVRMEYYYDD